MFLSLWFSAQVVQEVESKGSFQVQGFGHHAVDHYGLHFSFDHNLLQLNTFPRYVCDQKETKNNDKECISDWKWWTTRSYLTREHNEQLLCGKEIEPHKQ